MNFERSHFLKRISKASVALLLFCASAQSATPLPEEHVPAVVIGGGISGLTALDRLRNAGVTAQLYEAETRVGGRIWSTTDPETGLTTNLGAELVDSTHQTMIGLLNRAGIPLVSRDTDEFTRKNEFEFDGEIYTWEKFEQQVFNEDGGNAIRKIASDEAQIVKIGHALDRLSVSQYLRKIGAGKALTAFINSGVSSEMGQSVDKISARSLFNMLNVNASENTIHWLPHNDQKYVIKGGSQKLTDWFAERNSSAIHAESKLISIHSDDAKKFYLVFETPEGRKTIVTEHLINSIPLSALRNVDIRIRGYSQQSINSIEETAYGKHTKLLMYFDERTWQKPEINHSGDVLTDQGFQIWDSSYGQPGNSGVLTAYFGESLTDPAQIEAKKKLALETMERIFPGIQSHFIKMVVKNWESSYTGLPAPGHYYRERGDRRLNRLSIGNMVLAGEHTSFEQNGYMDGAASSGIAAAGKVLDDIESHAPNCEIFLLHLDVAPEFNK